MAKYSASCNIGKQAIISLHAYSHEVCVAATQDTYWQQLTQNSSISITVNGKYIPVELSSVCSNDDEPRLHLIIQSQYIEDTAQLDIICSRIHHDLVAFKNHDRPIYDYTNHQVLVFGSLFNSLPTQVFETARNLLGQHYCNIKKIKNTLGCSIDVDRSIPQRYCFTIRHKKPTVMDLAIIQIQALVRQAQDQYIIAFATQIGQTLVSPTDRVETMETSSSSNLYEFPSFTSFQSINKRRRVDDEGQPNTSGPIISDSDDSLDETILDETREQRRAPIELLLDGICKRMSDRTPVDDVAKAHEDSSQIKTYFRKANPSKMNSHDRDMSIELVEQEIDLRARGRNEHKCTLVFNKQLKVGAGVCDRIKRTAKARAYKQLIIMTRDTPRENLIVKEVKDGLWKAVIIPNKNE